MLSREITWPDHTIPHFHSKEFVILPRQHAALSGYSEIEIIWSTYVTSTFPCAIAPTTNTAGVSFGNLSTNSRSVTILGALWENPTLSQFGGKYFVTGPLTICIEAADDIKKGFISTHPGATRAMFMMWSMTRRDSHAPCQIAVSPHIHAQPVITL